MTIDDLVKIANGVVITPETVKVLEQDIRSMEKVFEQEEIDRQVTNADLNRSYTI